MHTLCTRAIWLCTPLCTKLCTAVGSYARSYARSYSSIPATAGSYARTMHARDLTMHAIMHEVMHSRRKLCTDLCTPVFAHPRHRWKLCTHYARAWFDHARRYAQSHARPSSYAWSYARPYSSMHATRYAQRSFGHCLMTARMLSGAASLSRSSSISSMATGALTTPRALSTHLSQKRIIRKQLACEYRSNYTDVTLTKRTRPHFVNMAFNSKL